MRRPTRRRRILASVRPRAASSPPSRDESGAGCMRTMGRCWVSRLGYYLQAAEA